MMKKKEGEKRKRKGDGIEKRELEKDRKLKTNEMGDFEIASL